MHKINEYTDPTATLTPKKVYQILRRIKFHILVIETHVSYPHSYYHLCPVMNNFGEINYTIQRRNIRRGPVYQYGLTEIKEWTNNHIHGFIWDVSTDPKPPLKLWYGSVIKTHSSMLI